ncbi:MAG TPA: hypothetical protein VLA62_08690, partial [Solirubrobacterales bacterium]|nr:hypothetical protein [Solirubrobacterales bacterium]
MDRLPGAPRAARRALVGTAPLRLEAVAACAISCLVLLCTAPSAHEFVSDADHGLQLAGALQVAFGRHPFLDFETAVYGPAVFYASYLGQWLSGWRLVGEVALVLLGYTAGYGLLFVLLHRIVGEGEASWARRAARWTLFLGLVLLAPRFYKYYLVLGPALFLLALHAYAQERGQRHLAWLGLATCALGLFRLDFAAYGVVAAVAAVLFTPAGSRRTPSSSCLGSLALFGAWGCLGAAPWLAFLAIRGDLLAVAARTLETTLAHRTGMALEAAPFSLEAGPFDGTNRLLVGFWALRLLPLVLLAALGGSWRRLEPGPRAFAIGLCLFAALSFLQASHRVDPSHLLQALPAQLVVVAWLAGAAFSRGRPALALLACLAGLVPPLLATGAPLALRKGGRGTLPERLRDWVRPVSELRDAALYAPETWPRLFAATAAFVNEVSTPQTGVLFLPIFPQLYWLSGRGFTAPLGWVQPGPWRDTSEERRFVQGLSSTRLVVDIPSALIGRDPDRNLRVYAPRIARHVYTRYGILRRIAWVYVLTDDPTLLDAHGAF